MDGITFDPNHGCGGPRVSRHRLSMGWYRKSCQCRWASRYVLYIGIMAFA